MILVIDVGTSGLRAAAVDHQARIHAYHYESCPPATPFAGLVEFDAAAMAAAVLRVAHATIADVGASTIAAVGVTSQRASTVAWQRSTGQPVGPGLGWQDLRTVMECMVAKAEHGLALAPNQSATKIGWLLANAPGARQLAEAGDLCVGTVDTWIAWVLTEGAVHATDHTNAAVTGLWSVATHQWSSSVCDTLGIPTDLLPVISPSSGVIGAATALPGSPPLAALVGDQQASLFGQSCVRPGQAKITFGTGGMLDVCLGDTPPADANRARNGTFPIVTVSDADGLRWGAEGIMLSAGTNVDWLRDDLGIIDSASDSHELAAQVDNAGGVVYVPALLGLGTPHWDYGARGALVGLTRGSTRAHVVRAVLEGIAHRGADLVEAVVADTGIDVPTLRIDGGMSTNPTFTQALANAAQRPVEVAPTTQATTLGAAFLAGLAVGQWSTIDDIDSLWQPAARVEPGPRLDREQWRKAVGASAGWIPDLSALDF